MSKNNNNNNTDREGRKGTKKAQQIQKIVIKMVEFSLNILLKLFQMQSLKRPGERQIVRLH
jgi:hypothetical protein